MTNGNQSLMELIFIAAEVRKHEDLVGKKHAELTRLWGEAADAIEQHQKFVEHCKNAFNEMAAKNDKSRRVVVDELKSLGKLDKDAFLKPSVANSIRRALLAGKRLLRAMREQEAYADELKLELSRLVALKVRARKLKAE